jgi:chorismate synthase
MSTFGTLFRVTTFGESHCKGVGCVIDGCPPLLPLTEVRCFRDRLPEKLENAFWLVLQADIQPQLTRRRPGQSRITTARAESDVYVCCSNLFVQVLHANTGGMLVFRVTIVSGTEGGRTLGTPVALLVPNEDVRPADYKEMVNIPRPGHADYTYKVRLVVFAGCFRALV